MFAILELVRNLPVREFNTGENILSQGDRSGHLYVLIEGSVEVIKDGVTVAQVSDPGAIFGDLSALLQVPHTAAVRAVKPARFHLIEHPRAFLERSPQACLHLCQLLARRLDSVNKYLVDVKKQYEGHDHLSMVDGVIDSLMHRQPRQRIAPRASTIRDPELPD